MKKTNKYIKHIKRFSIMIVTLLLSFTIMTQKAYAYIPDNTFYYGKTELINYDISDNGLYYTNTLRFRFTSRESNDFPNDYEVGETSLKHIFNIFKDYKLNEIEFLTINKYIFPIDDTLILIRAGQEIDTIGRPNRIMFDLEGDSIRFENKDGYAFYRLTYADINVSDTFILKTKRYFSTESSFEEGYDLGKSDGHQIGYDKAKDLYGIYDNNQWYTAEQWGDMEFNRGSQSSESEAYDEGYRKGSNDSFMASIKDWIVPAIIVVLFLGGAISIIVKKREG